MIRRMPNGRPHRARGKSFRWRRLVDLALAIVILTLLAVIAVRGPFNSPAETLSGTMRAADGDSLVYGAARIRLEGIDAPELGQTCGRSGVDYACGREAHRALVLMILDRVVSCQSGRRDRYGRHLARCAAGGVNLNRAMVEEGWAVAYGDYDREEIAARHAGRGLWGGTFERPQEWRRVHGGLAENQHDWLAALFDWLRGLFGT